MKKGVVLVMENNKAIRKEVLYFIISKDSIHCVDNEGNEFYARYTALVKEQSSC